MARDQLPRTNSSRKVLHKLILAGFFLSFSACASASVSQLENAVIENVSPTETIEETPIVPQASATPTPEILIPERFQSDLLRDGVLPESYIEDSCEYLEMRWDPEGSSPGTVVAPIMFHSIRPYGEEVTDPSWINRDLFDATIDLAMDLGFETITSQQLVAFLNDNTKIPERSMLLILDDRRPGTAEDYFLPVLEANEWTATLAWPIGDTDIRQGLWEWIERLNETGYFDIQSHGFKHNIYLSESLSEEIVREEIFSSIPVLEEHFGERPIAYIWPGGNYTQLGVDIAQEVGFQLGFTIHSRGPILFNWIPQGEMEAAIGEPLMLLPRFWSSAALLNLEQAADIGAAARAFAKDNYAAEATWYQANCGSQLPAQVEINGND